MKNILYFYPDNPAILDQGNNARANALLQYFKKRSFIVDFVHECNSEEITILKEQNLIRNEWQLKKTVLNFKHLIFKIAPTKINKGICKIFWKNRYKTNIDLDRLKKGYKELFESILKENTYDYIIISYINWLNLVKDSKHLKDAKLIIDTHDFITSQLHKEKHFKLGYYFEREIEALRFFDKIWAISIEEQFLFSQFIDTQKVELIPHGTKDNTDKSSKNKNIDLLYVASNNPHNIKSIQWFFDKVYPLLPTSINITTIGKICEFIPNLNNVTKIHFVENLDQYYQKTKICLCPMLSGTGLKIKVVESLSYGIPVVCNSRGVDGLLNKSKNGCLVTDSEIEFSKNILKLLSNETFYKKTANNAQSFFKDTLSELVAYQNLDKSFGIITQ